METTMTTISRIKATNCFSFAEFAVDIPPGGAIVEGGNAEGKTSILKIVRAALVEKGATPDMIRKGSTKGEILVCVDNHFVQRVMTLGEKFKTTLRVTDGAGKVVPEPAAFLKNLLGLSPLDPIELFMERDKGKRRAKILSAIPCTVTAEQLAAWVPSGMNLIPVLGQGSDGCADLSGHGLEVVERVRKALYAQRTEANRLAKERQAATDQAIAKEGAAYDALSAFRIENALPEMALDLSHAQRAVEEAKRAQVALDEQQKAAEQSAKGQAKTREKIDELQRKASDKRANAPLAPTAEQFEAARQGEQEATDALVPAQALVDELEQKLVQARQDLETKKNALVYAKSAWEALSAQEQRAEAAVDEIESIEGQAIGLEQALGSLPIAPNEAQFSHAERRIVAASAAVEYAKKSAELATLADAVDKARALLRGAYEDAAALDKAVKALADDAPAALLAAADGISGLSIDGDDVFLDGVSLDQLCGQEQLFFAVEIARRLNAKSKLICVDGLEALDRKHRMAFIERATKGGYQLIATRVIEDGGDPVAVPIHVADA
jgi:hypothetical protein